VVLAPAILNDTQKLFEMAERGGSNLNLEARQAIDHATEIGRGGVWRQAFACLATRWFAQPRNTSEDKSRLSTSIK
jgi:hypothetical protein